MKMISRIAVALALLVATVGTTTLHADTFDRVAPEVVTSGAEGGPTVRVTNNNYGHVRVYVVDSENRRHLLGMVSPSRVKDLQIPAGLVRENGTVQLRVYPVLLVQPPVRRRLQGRPGIETKDLSVQSDQVIQLYLERDLTNSVVGIVSIL